MTSRGTQVMPSCLPLMPRSWRFCFIYYALKHYNSFIFTGSSEKREYCSTNQWMYWGIKFIIVTINYNSFRSHNTTFTYSALSVCPDLVPKRCCRRRARMGPRLDARFWRIGLWWRGGVIRTQVREQASRIIPILLAVYTPPTNNSRLHRLPHVSTEIDHSSGWKVPGRFGLSSNTLSGRH